MPPFPSQKIQHRPGDGNINRSTNSKKSCDKLVPLGSKLFNVWSENGLGAKEAAPYATDGGEDDAYNPNVSVWAREHFPEAGGKEYLCGLAS